MKIGAFQEYNNVLYYLDAAIKDYVPWSDFKKKFVAHNVDIDSFKFVPTFREQDSDDWSGAKAAFEQNLVDMKVSWFVYIDKDGDVKPLVVGKSGSLLVN